MRGVRRWNSGYIWVRAACGCVVHEREVMGRTQLVLGRVQGLIRSLGQAGTGGENPYIACDGWKARKECCAFGNGHEDLSGYGCHGKCGIDVCHER